jgi:hypothetical protein
MKKILVIFLPIIAFSDLNMSEVNSVLLNIHASKELKYYSSDINSAIDKKIKFTSFDDADILLFPKKTDTQKIIDNKIAIVSSYQELKDNNNSIGAIYLKKDRTQIIFIKERLKNKGLTLVKKFNKYIVPVCYLTTDCL